MLELRADNPEEVRFCREYEAMIASLIGKGTDEFTEAYDPTIESSCSVAWVSAWKKDPAEGLIGVQ